MSKKINKGEFGSLYLKKWILSHDFSNSDSGINSNDALAGFSKIIRKVLKNRGFTTQEDVDRFINCDEHSVDFLKDPFELKDMEQAVERIRRAIENEEKIIIYGDYDVDGMTSTIVLFLYLKELGADIDYYIPSREIDGYGLSIKLIDKFESKYQLIITVDNGITAIDEVNYANNLGMDVIVTDHHVPLEILPDAIAVVDPHRKDCDSNCEMLCGVGVVFKLVSALDGDSQKILDRYSDIICLGTIADVVPLVGENRVITQEGIKKMKSDPNKGLKALFKESEMNIDDISSTAISYRIAPRLNSASRMGQIFLAMDLLLSDDDKEVVEIAKQLCAVNCERKAIEQEMMDEINYMISQNPDMVSNDVIVIAKQGWNHSISGINASRLADRYNKPCILIAIDGDEANASGRSVEGFSLIDAIDFCKDCLVRYGGHFSAVGFTIKPENIDRFSQKIQGYAKKMLNQFSIKSYNVDCEIGLEDVSINNINDLKLLEPYGASNEMPMVMIRNLKIKNVISISNGKYTKVVVLDENNFKMDLMAFNITYGDFFYRVGELVDVVVTLDLNTYNSVTSPRAVIKDIRLANFDQDTYFQHVIEYSKYKKRCEGLMEQQTDFDINLVKSNLPIRDEVGVVYRYLRMMPSFTFVSYHQLIEYLFIKLQSYKFSYIKLGLILDILEEMAVVSFDSKVKILKAQKANIKLTRTYQTLLEL